jgi:hypothetical protein
LLLEIQRKFEEEKKKIHKTFEVRLPGVEPGSIAWKAIILTVGLQTPGWEIILLKINNYKT